MEEDLGVINKWVDTHRQHFPLVLEITVGLRTTDKVIYCKEILKEYLEYI